MTPEDVFSLAGAAVLPGWLILMFAPRRWPWLNGVPLLVIPAALSALYAGLILREFSAGVEAGGGYGTLAEVRNLLSGDWMLLAGWVHYLAFDLMIGAIAAARMDRAKVSRLTQGFILPFIFLFGPLGWLLALAVEAGLRPSSRISTMLTPTLRPMEA